MISFVSKRFFYRDQIEELFIVMVYCMYSQHLTLSIFQLISLFFDCNILSKARYSLFVLKVTLNPNQSVNHLLPEFMVGNVGSLYEDMWYTHPL